MKTNQEIFKEFEDTFNRKDGADLQVCLVPKIDSKFKFWGIEVITEDIKQFIAKIRQEDKLELIKEIEKEMDKFSRVNSGNENGRNIGVEIERDGRIIINYKDEDLTIPDFAGKLFRDLIEIIKN